MTDGSSVPAGPGIVQQFFGGQPIHLIGGEDFRTPEDFETGEPSELRKHRIEHGWLSFGIYFHLLALMVDGSTYRARIGGDYTLQFIPQDQIATFRPDEGDGS